MQKITVVICQAQIDSGKNKFPIKKIRVSKNAENKKTKKGIQRGDITHQCLLTLCDSPLNKAGFMKIYISTCHNLLIEINPLCKIPRTLKRFNGLMSQLVRNLSIKSDCGQTLMKIVKGPITEHLEPNTARIELCQIGEKISNLALKEYIDRGIVFFVNAIASGDDGKCEYAELKMKVSDFGLSAALCCGKVCNILEEILEIF